MLTALALTGAMLMAPGQGVAPTGEGSGTLKIENPRLTFGYLGGARTDNTLPAGDIFFLFFDINGVSIDPTGLASYSMAMTVSDAKGKVVFEQKPTPQKAFLPLGSPSLPAFARLDVPLDFAPGAYVCRIDVVDLTAKTKATIDHKFTIKAKEFGIVTLYTSSDAKGELFAPPMGMVGHMLWVHFVAVMFDRDAKKQPNLEVELLMVDADGKPTVAKPTILEINSGVEEGDSGIPLRFPLLLNRPGKFTLKLKATDKITKKTSLAEFPIEVMPQRK